MIHVVTGHICSGKTTWVRDHAGPGDVVIDFDLIAAALSPAGTSDHDWPQPVADIARAVRWMAIDEAVRLHARRLVPNVWIVHAYPSADDLAKYRRLGAGLREQICDPATLRARAATERPPRMRQELERRLATT